MVHGPVSDRTLYTQIIGFPRCKMSLNSVPIEEELRKNSALTKADIDLLKSCAIIPLSKTTREGYKVILIRPFYVAQKNISSTNAIKYLNMVLDLNIYEEGTHEGYVFVVDLHGANFFDPRSFNVTAVKAYFDYLQKYVPIRWFGLHFVDTVFPLTAQNNRLTRMTIVQNDYVDAMYFHLDLDSLNEVVPLHVLPNEMGGQAGPLKDLHEDQLRKLRENWLWFLTMESQEKSACMIRGVHEMKLFLKDLKTDIHGLGNVPFAV
ncbi:alpha-tocopherol transfer protein-like isoform X2 [Phymastichus coffea]|uniref:alpha-tocopherol transfer protein-like isoform X2 n=1 Tax=Phymastichus coffea TaxID=108790 RepID=UPI00273B362B|nr:alpha-tocopherol transfer protein-like isoform X2 [Phymastichus coffea]